MDVFMFKYESIFNVQYAGFLHLNLCFCYPISLGCMLLSGRGIFIDELDECLGCHQLEEPQTGGRNLFQLISDSRSTFKSQVKRPTHFG